MEKQDPNMELWNKVCETDPKITKQVSQRGGFTAICAQAQCKRATELWGMYGKAWGLDNCKWEYLRDAKGEIIEVSLDATFSMPDGTFPISGDMAFRVGNDTRKKLMTDLTTKALSKLGFNADVFEGKFDDNKYIAEMNKKFNSKENKSPELTEQNKKVLGLICDELQKKLPEGKEVDEKLVANIFWSQGGRHPSDEKTISTVVVWFLSHNKPEAWSKAAEVGDVTFRAYLKVHEAKIPDGWFTDRSKFNALVKSEIVNMPKDGNSMLWVIENIKLEDILSEKEE